VTSQPDPVREFAPAKINLFLHVGQKRVDGFHALRSLVVFADVGDRVTIELGQEPSLEVVGPFAEELADGADNLVLRAARALAAHLGRDPNVRLVLEKNLPVSSGIGGGSADAAATLRGLLRFWKSSFDETELRSIAETLGSDVPVCLKSHSSWMGGRGEVVERADPVPPVPMLLVNPLIAVPTAKVFAALRTRSGVAAAMQARWHSSSDLIDFLRTTRNDLQEPARSLVPAIADVVDTLASFRGSLLARMSGSGATCFALFEDKPSRDQAAQQLAAQHRGWWIAPSAIVDDR
jgi:4-diphosphocytidyl-2-C-methyl-D-erythritol kinase